MLSDGGGGGGGVRSIARVQNVHHKATRLSDHMRTRRSGLYFFYFFFFIVF